MSEETVVTPVPNATAPEAPDFSFEQQNKILRLHRDVLLSQAQLKATAEYRRAEAALNVLNDFIGVLRSELGLDPKFVLDLDSLKFVVTA
jgi:hypothetical protein